jgi:hypothetical protein
MFITCEIKFKNTPPDFELVREKLSKSTGLSNLNLNEPKSEFVHPLSDGKGFTFYRQGNSIFIGTGLDEPIYLLDAMIYVLTELGGRIDFELPESASKKWLEVKHLY